MKKQNVKRSVMIAAACLTLGMQAQPLMAEEAEVATELTTEAAAEAAAEEAVEIESEAVESAELTLEETEAENDAEAAAYSYDELTVGAATAFDGNFFTEMWGNVVSDLDVRTLIHGYDLVEWVSADGIFRLDPSVVSGTVVTENAAGDRTYTISLYDDLAYSDGTQITAYDYAFSWLLESAPQIDALGATAKDLRYIKGYDAYRNGESQSFSGIRVLSADTLAVTIDGAYLPFFYEAALLDCTPYPISVIAPGCRVVDNGNGAQIVNADESVTEPLFTSDLLTSTILGENGYRSHPSVVSGPYVLTSFDGTTASFEINPNYKGNSDGVKPSIQKLNYTTAANDTMIGDLKNKDFGLLNKVTNLDTLMEGMQTVTGSEEYTMSNYPRSGMSFVSFCCERPTVSSAAVRQAIAMCMDKDALVADYVGNFGLRVDGYFGLGQWMYQVVNGNLAYPLEQPEENATEEEKKKYEEDKAAWEALSLDDVPVYNLDVQAAADLLASDGWTLNRDGGEFNPETDDVRCKEIDGQLVALDLRLIYPEGNRIGDSLQAAFADHLKEAGINLTLEALPMQDLLREYYRQNGARSMDMIYLATNFDLVFDPSRTFKPSTPDDLNEAANTTGIADQQLYDLAVAMRTTEQGDTLSYTQKWVEFQKRFAEVLPLIPVYSNVYFDFHTTMLQNYNIAANTTWGQAIVEAYLGDPMPEVETEAETE